MTNTPIPWSAGRWTNEPAGTAEVRNNLCVTCEPKSDAWRVTAYGFEADSEHALLGTFDYESAIEVVVTADFDGEFDQAGLFLKAGPEEWVKAGLEYSDGALQVGAVVTHGTSDWSVGPVPEWTGKKVRIRASWSKDAVTIRAGLDGEDLRLVRLLNWPQALETSAGPYACAPSREPGDDLTVTFHEWSVGAPDSSIH